MSLYQNFKLLTPEDLPILNELSSIHDSLSYLEQNDSFLNELDDLRKNILLIRGSSANSFLHLNCDFIMLIIGINAIGFSIITRSDFTAVYDWLLKSISTNDELLLNDIPLQERILSFLTIKFHSDDEYVFGNILEWFYWLFYYDRVTAGLRNFAIDAFEIYMRVLFRFEINEKIALDAIIQIHSWSYNIDRVRFNEIYKKIEEFRNKTEDRQAQKDIKLHYTTIGGIHSIKTTQAWASDLLENHRDQLLSHEVFQTMVTSIGNSISIYESIRSDLLIELNTYLKGYQNLNTNYTIVRQTQARLFPFLHQLINILVKNCKVEDAKIFLGIWYRIDAREFIKYPLIVLLSIDNECIYLINNTIYSFERKNEIYHNFTLSLNSFFRTYNTIAELPNQVEMNFDIEKFGIPVIDASSPYEKSCCALLKFDEINFDMPIERNTGIISIPAQRIPVQPLLVKYKNTCIPFSVSLKEPFESRKIKNILVIEGDAFTVPQEADDLERICRDHAIKIKRITFEKGKSIILSEYQNPDYDCVFILAHGTYEHYNVQDSEIHLSDKIKLYPSELIPNISQTMNTQRLLVLNICDGASFTNYNNALIENGISVRACGPSQAVIAHLWAIPFQFAPLFSKLLLLALIRSNGENFLTGYRNCLQLLSGQLNLEENEYISKSNIDFLELNSDIIYIWGSSAYFI
ncbi:hypothetical protein EHR04_02400 [Leptospira levettii]|uniref:hypothetical protein n=1 Tax=Leptospira levettii TaxID=2023178 RepID=UPI00109259C3|nr:hypothetical protein [Leptospira levettii]TGM78631.1 hypothetical protein EHR04_02400 [Leptospira levettii]